MTSSKYVAIASLSTTQVVEPKTKLTMIGFGTYMVGDPVENNHPVSLYLRKVDVNVIGLEDCQNLWEDVASIQDNNICTSTENDIGSCVVSFEILEILFYIQNYILKFK